MLSFMGRKGKDDEENKEASGSSSNSPGEPGEDSYEDGGEDEEEEEEIVEEDIMEDNVNTAAPDGEITKTSGSDINTSSFDELWLDEFSVQAATDAWRMFLNAAESREAAGEVLYTAVFESAPSLQSLFTTPKAIQAMKFLNELSAFITNLGDPPRLKIMVETLTFSDFIMLPFDTVPRVALFRDAILDIFTVELGDKFSDVARDSWTKLLNYVGGALIYVKANYAERINILLESWKLARDDNNSNSKSVMELHDDDDDEATKARKEEAARILQEQRKQEEKSSKSSWASRFGRKKDTDDAGGEAGATTTKEAASSGSLNANQVPTTYKEMFFFNSAVMGFGTSEWMAEVLDCFDNIVTNVANSARLQEECDILALRISKVAKGNVNFGEYKSCMLASLRSLLPKEWSTQHEVSWSWLWENVERIVSKNMGNPPKWEKALTKFLRSLDENEKFEIRKDIYARFFAAAPAGQDYFKQSNTYLHFIADRIIEMTLELYHAPVKMVDDVSALGLRHVGYAIPTEFFGPFVTACVDVMMTVTDNADSVEAFRWSLGLISKMLVRTITEGSTIVMRAINTNNAKQVKKAISCAPRGERAEWMLTVQVGTQSISPLAWSIESGALDAAQAIVTDLLTFRADRDRYYYGMDQLFERHPEIVKTLVDNAPTVLPYLLDGLIWRSRITEDGLRRSNYYVRHLLMDQEEQFSPTLAWIAKANDPRLVTHSILAFLSDTVWGRLAQRTFLFRKSWFLFTLLVFIGGQSILKRLNEGNHDATQRVFVFAFRTFIYVFSLTQLLWTHISKLARQWKNKQIMWIYGVIPLPEYMKSWQEVASFCLTIMLILMLVCEPILWCFGHDGGRLFFQECKEADNVQMSYSIFSMLAMLLYFALLIDLAVLSTKVSAYVLVFFRMLSEVFLFLLALAATLLAFASGISVIKHNCKDFAGIHKGLLTLLEMTTQMYDGDRYETYEGDSLVVVCIFVFLIVIFVFLLNMLVAQLTCAYEAVYVDMIGYARLERIEIIVGIMPAVSEKRWRNFIETLRLDQKVEFNAGDVGVTGGIQVIEPANLNPTTEDFIKRFGGSTSPEMQWPADAEDAGDEEDDRFERLENLIQKTLKRMTKGGSDKGRRGDERGSSGQSGSNSKDDSGSKSTDTDADAGEEEDS
jgi:hypothetical protein